MEVANTTWETNILAVFGVFTTQRHPTNNFTNNNLTNNAAADGRQAGDHLRQIAEDVVVWPESSERTRRALSDD